MALSLRYVGNRPYTEIRLSKHVVAGFSRGMIRDDIPEDLIRDKFIPMIENGATAWEVVGTSKKQAKKMLEVVEEPTPVAEPEPEPEPEPVVEEVVEEEPVPATTDAEVDVDILLAAAGFDSTMTRAQMMAWCSDKGISVNNRSTKASMTDAAREHITGASE